MSPHLDDETIAAWSAGAITADERERAIEHVASCAACRAVVGYLVGQAATPARIGRYEIKGQLGAGGMGVVLRAHDASLGRDVAIKMIKSTLIEPAHRDRMLREAQAMAAVTHPNVVTVYELGEAGDELFVAMEHVTGTMLQRWLTGHRSHAERARVALGVGRGIVAVHAAGLLHRDIKPDNIVVRPDGTPILVDFGLARAVATPALGAGSGIAGTPRYLAPEVAAGAPASAASDQYQWWTIVEDTFGTDARIARLVARGHAPDPAQRFPSMAAAVDALARALRPRRQRIALAVLGGIVATVVVTAALWPARESACDMPPPKAWTAERRAAAEKNLAAAGLDPKPVLAAIDERAGTTRSLRARACHEIERGGNARAEWTRRQVCLDETWSRAVRELDDLVAGGDANVREAADDLVEVLPAVQCGRGVLPASVLPLSGEPRKRYVDFVNRLQTIEMNTKLTPKQRGQALHALEPEVTRLAYPPAEARWRWAMAHTLNDAGDSNGATAEYDRTAQAGLAAGDDDLYVRALIAELQTAGGVSAERITQLAAQAAAGAARLGNPQIEAQLVLARAHVAMERGETQAARKLFEEADAKFQAIAIAPMAMHMATMQNLGALSMEVGELDLAQRQLDRAVELARGRYGADSAQLWEARAARATVLLARRDFAAAETELSAAADGLERTNPSGGQAGLTRAYLCVLLRTQAKLVEARAACDASVTSMAKIVGDDSPALVWPLTLRGQIDIAAGTPADGLPFLRRAVEIGTKNHVRPVEVTIAKTQLAIALADSGHQAEAMTLAREVAPLLRAPELAETLGDFVKTFPKLAPQ